MPFRHAGNRADSVEIYQFGRSICHPAVVELFPGCDDENQPYQEVYVNVGGTWGVLLGADAIPGLLPGTPGATGGVPGSNDL